MKITPTIYSAAYFAMMKSHKKEFKMTDSEQFDIFFKALLIYLIQMFFCFCCYFMGKVKFVLNNNVCLQLALIFATLLLHIGCLPGSKSGMYMMKYALCHPEKFSHPEVAFLLGVMTISAMWIAEFINVGKATQRKSAQELITSYIGFKSIIDVPSIYLSSINNMPIKGKIGTVTATKARKQSLRSQEETFTGITFCNVIYVVCKFFYNTFYYYFFTFSVIFVPIAAVLYKKEMSE